MGRAEVTSEQISNGDVWREDLNVSDAGKAVVRKVTSSGVGILRTESGVDAGTGDIDLSLKAGGFGMERAWTEKVASESVSGNTFVEYDSLVFDVVDSATNEFRVNADFFYGHNSASNDIRVQLFLDGVQIAQEFRAEVKDSGTDQRYQNNILDYLNNLSIGSHTLSLRYRPASSNRQSRMYRSIIEAWRVA